MRPAEALELAARLRADTRTAGWMRWVKSLIDASFPESSQLYGHETTGEMAAYFTTGVRTGLERAETYLVTAEMNGLIRRAAEDLRGDEVFSGPELLPSRIGFLVFEDPYINSTESGDYTTRAISWHHRDNDGGGVTFVEYARHDDVPDIFVAAGGPENEVEVRRAARDAGEIAPRRITDVNWGESLREASRWLYEGEDDAPLQESVLMLLSLLTLMQQTIAVTSPVKLGEKRAATVARRGVRPAVSVVTLRRRSAPPTGESAVVERDHRWAVRGHWRNQRFGPGLSRVRSVYISPYIKGPDDAPLVVRPRVTRLAR